MIGAMVSILWAALLLGAFTGLRSFTPVTAACWAARLGWISLMGTPLSFFGNGAAVAVATLLMAGELIGDKLPWIPDRTSPVALGGRVVLAALCGLALGYAAGGQLAPAAVAGVFGALAGAFGGFQLRRVLVRRGGWPDFAVALLEDILAVGGSLLILANAG